MADGERAERPERTPISLARTIRFLITTLTAWASRRQFGKIEIVVQNGQIMFVHENRSYASGALPHEQSPVGEVADRAVKELREDARTS